MCHLGLEGSLFLGGFHLFGVKDKQQIHNLKLQSQTW